MELNECLTLFLLRKSAISDNTNWGPLSDTSCSGRPYAAKIYLRMLTIFSVVVLIISTTSGHIECASTTIKKLFPRKGPAKSMWIRFQGLVGHAQGCRGATVGVDNKIWQFKVLNVLVQAWPPKVASGHDFLQCNSWEVAVQFL